MIEVKRSLLQDDAHPTLVTYADHSKLSAMMGAVAEKKGPGEVAGTIAGQKRRAEQDSRQGHGRPWQTWVWRPGRQTPWGGRDTP